jgi:hypothetical protein
MEGIDVLAELYDALESDPGNTFILERIIECWAAAGNRGTASTLFPKTICIFCARG